MYSVVGLVASHPATLWSACRRPWWTLGTKARWCRMSCRRGPQIPLRQMPAECQMTGDRVVLMGWEAWSP